MAMGGRRGLRGVPGRLRDCERAAAAVGRRLRRRARARAGDLAPRRVDRCGAVPLAARIHRFAGGFPRAFVQPVVLLTMLLAMRRRDAAAAVVAGAGALFYPTAGVLAVGVLALSAVRGWRIDVRRAAFAAVAAVSLLTAVLVPRLQAGGAPQVMSAAEARAFPEFGPHGTLPFFVDSLLRYLSQNRSGFDLRLAGSILVVAGLALLVVRWRDVRGLAPEVLAMPVASLGGFALAQLVLFQLYLPHRYTYPLVAFFAIAVAVLLRPLCQAGGRRGLAWLAGPAAVAAVTVFAFPLAPAPPRGAVTWIVAALAAGAAIAVALWRAPERLRTGAGAAATGALLLALILVLPNGETHGKRCPQTPAIDYLAQPAEGRRSRRRPAGPHVRAGERRAGRRDLRTTRALLRGRRVPGRSRPDVRGTAGRVRLVAGRDHRAEHALRRDTPVDPPRRRGPGRTLGPAPAPVRPLRPRPAARRRARVASPSGGVPAVAARRGRGLRHRLRLRAARPTHATAVCDRTAAGPACAGPAFANREPGIRVSRRSPSGCRGGGGARLSSRLPVRPRSRRAGFRRRSRRHPSRSRRPPGSAPAPSA